MANDCCQPSLHKRLSSRNSGFGSRFAKEEIVKFVSAEDAMELTEREERKQGQ
jgi:hypothetical protein